MSKKIACLHKSIQCQTRQAQQLLKRNEKKHFDQSFLIKALVIFNAFNTCRLTCYLCIVTDRV